MKRSTRIFAAWMSALLIIYLVTYFKLADSPLSLRISLSQLAVFPLVVVFLWKAPIGYLKVPLPVLLLALLGVGFASGREYLLNGGKRLRVVVARLSGDEMETESRILTAQIRRRFTGGRNYYLQRHFREFSDQSEVVRWLAEDAGVQAVIWGDRRWLRLSLPLTSPVQLSDLHGGDDRHLFKGVFLAPGPILVGLSYNPRRDSAAFLGSLITGLPVNPHAALSAEAESALLLAASQRSAWSSFAHRAFPHWLLGNSYLAKALSGGDLANLRCAERSYREALADLRPGDNPELRLASYTNLGAVAYARAVLETNRSQIRQARRLWRAVAAKGGKFRAHRYTSSQVARLNLKQLRSNRVRRSKDQAKRINLGRGSKQQRYVAVDTNGGKKRIERVGRERLNGLKRMK